MADDLCVCQSVDLFQATCPITRMSSNDVAEYLYENLNEESKKYFDEAVELLPGNVKFACRQSGQTEKSCFLGRVLPNFDKKYTVVSGNEVFRLFAENAAGNLFKEGRMGFLASHADKLNFVTLIDEASKVLLAKFFPYLEGYVSNVSEDASLPEINRWPMSIASGIDGDTFKVILYLGGKLCDAIELSLRFSGIDTPESKVVGKFTPHLTALINKFVDEYGLEEKDRSYLYSILKKRMLFLGKLPALLSKEFLAYVNQSAKSGELPFSLEESLVRYTKPDDIMCNMPEVYDFYGRTLGTIIVNDPELIVKFMEERLPEVMASTEARQLYAEMQLTSDEKNWLDDLEDRKGFVDGIVESVFGGEKKEYGELAKILDPAQVKKPEEMFSKEVCKGMAQDWKKVNEKVDRSDDFNASLAMMGVAWVYPKYRNHNADKYMMIRETAISSAIALWGDPIFTIIDPVANGLDKSKGVFVKPEFPNDCLSVSTTF